MIFKNPRQNSFLFSGILFVIGFMIKPVLSIPLAIIGFILGEIVSKLIIENAEDEKSLREIAAETKSKEDKLEQMISNLNNYLESISIEGQQLINELKKSWVEANAITSKHGYGPGHDTYYDFRDGNRDFIKQRLETTIRLFHHKKHDPELSGWKEFETMLKNRSNSCSYKWGVNKCGIEIHRIEPDLYTLCEIHCDSYYK